MGYDVTSDNLTSSSLSDLTFYKSKKKSCARSLLSFETPFMLLGGEISRFEHLDIRKFWKVGVEK
jgi:hypothetical protein